MFSRRRHESAFTLIETLVAMIIISILTAAAVMGYGKQQELAVDRTVKADIKNASTFMKEDLVKEGHYPQEFSASFSDWTRNNELELTQQGSCVVGTSPDYENIFWRYSLVDNELSKDPCPPPESENIPPAPEVDGNVGAVTPSPPEVSPEPEEEEEEEWTGARIITVDPILYTGFSNQATNNLTLEDNGDLLVEGDFQCNSNVSVSGSVIVTGDAYMTNDCLVGGNLWVGGNLRIDSSPHIKGEVQVKGNMSYQSTATIEGDVWLGGKLTIIDGRTVDQLQSSGSLQSELHEHSFVPNFKSDEFPVNKVNGTLITWSNWLKKQASYHPSTPSWSPIYQGTGCTITPGANWSLPGDILVKESTNVDARSCSKVEVGGGGKIKLEADLTLFVNSFTASNGIHFQSADGKAHRVNIIVPTQGATPNRVCSDQKSINLGSNSTGDENIHVVIYTESKVSMGGNTQFTGEVMSGCSQIWGNTTLIKN